MAKVLEVVTKTCQEVNCDDFRPPSKISPMNALEDHIHIKTESRRWRGSGLMKIMAKVSM